MRRTFTLSIVFLITVAFWSCSDSVDIPDNLMSRPQSLTGLRKVKIRENLVFGNTAIKAVVISDAKSGNVESGSIIVQEEGKDAAVTLQLSSKDHQFKASDEVTIDLNGASLGYFNGELVVSGLPLNQVVATGKSVTITPKVSNLPTLLMNATYWGPILVKLEKVEISGGINGLFSGELTLDDGVGTVFSEILPASDFKDNTVPDFVESYIGILRMKDSKFYINPRNLDDVQIGLKELLEDFEGPAGTSYDQKTLAFRTGSWLLDGGITAATAADLKTGLQSIRLQGTIGNPQRNGILSMGFDLRGVKTIKLSHGIYPAAAETSNVNPTTLKVEVSYDGGKSYQFLKQLEIDVKSTVLKNDIIEVNAGFSEQVRFRIVNSSTPFANQSRPRINIDDILFQF